MKKWLGCLEAICKNLQLITPLTLLLKFHYVAIGFGIAIPME
jgi:hypothetical protein